MVHRMRISVYIYNYQDKTDHVCCFKAETKLFKYQKKLDLWGII